MAEEERGFVIRDRRGRGAESETKPTESAEPASTLKSETAPDAHGKSVPPMNFLTFVYSLGTSALMLLGENPNAGASATAPNLGHAQEIIDILTMLEGKTKGNLNKDEETILEEMLYTLRIKYVEKASKP